MAEEGAPAAGTEGTEEGGRGEPAHRAWELPARLYLHLLSQAPRAPGGVSKTHVFQDIPPKENCSTLFWSRTRQVNGLEEPFPRPHFLPPLQGEM